jgi:hypothetical protein
MISEHRVIAINPRPSVMAYFLHETYQVFETIKGLVFLSCTLLLCQDDRSQDDWFLPRRRDRPLQVEHE